MVSLKAVAKSDRDAFIRLSISFLGVGGVYVRSIDGKMAQAEENGIRFGDGGVAGLRMCNKCGGVFVRTYESVSMTFAASVAGLWSHSKSEESENA